jgi:hypothetical protein
LNIFPTFLAIKKKITLTQKNKNTPPLNWIKIMAKVVEKKTLHSI